MLKLISKSSYKHIDWTSVKLMSHLRKTDKVSKVGNWEKLTAELNPYHMRIFEPWKKDVQSCIKIGMKLYKELSS